MFKQLSNPELKEIPEKLEHGESDQYELRNRLIFRKYNDSSLFYVPFSMIPSVMRSCHDGTGYVGVDKTVELILRAYWFRDLRKKVKAHVGNCLKCLVYNVHSGKSEGELHIWDRARWQ